MHFDPRCADFVHPRHLQFFTDAAVEFNCHILVRLTGAYSISWVGCEGYTGKRVDLKAKTARKGVIGHDVTGLVCSPFIHPGAFTDLTDAQTCWKKSLPLITVPPGNAGFDDRKPLPMPTTRPYILQNNPRHRHYGCIAWVEMGLVTPHYVHGDYDLYAIVPAGRAFRPADARQAAQRGRTTPMTRPDAGLAERVNAGTPDNTGPLAFSLASYINTRIAIGSRHYANALMVNHGENIHHPDASEGLTHERVLVFLARPEAGQMTRFLLGEREHRQFFRNA